jgi:hypothetical protein
MTFFIVKMDPRQTQRGKEYVETCADPEKHENNTEIYR